MTTVAYRDGVMAADSKGDWGGSPTDENKIFTTDKYLFGHSGNLSLGLALWEELDEFLIDGNLPEMYRWSKYSIDRKDVPIGAILVDRETDEFWVLDSDRLRKISLAGGGPFFAIGSGTDYALGAMAAGASATRAVHIASGFDHYTGGLIQSVCTKSASTSSDFF